jgi:hypothetical protein
MTTLDSFYNEIETGRKGRNWGYSTGLPKLDKLTDGVKKANYTIMFALSGVGKSTITLYSYVYKPIMEHLEDDKLEIMFFNLEMKKEFILAKLLSIYLYETYNIRIGAKQILSIEMNYALSDEIYEKIKESRQWLEKVCKILHFDGGIMNSKTFYFKVINFLKDRGTFVDIDHPSHGYTPNNPEKVILFIGDHLNLTRPQPGATKKQEIDGVSDWCVKFRNWTSCSFLWIMQANRTGTSMARIQGGYPEPRIEDMMDSSVPGFDAETVLALYNPTKDKIANYRGYNIDKMEGKCRSIICLKNRYGESDAADVLYFDGLIGYYKELPKPTEIYDYNNIFKDEKKESNNNLTFSL